MLPAVYYMCLSIQAVHLHAEKSTQAVHLHAEEYACSHRWALYAFLFET